MKIAVLCSGGVDSSLALALLKKQGHQVVAFYLKIWLEDELSYLTDCPWQEDLQYVQQLCQQLDVPLEIVSLQNDYWQLVIHDALEQIRLGQTPNPDVFCNTKIKFGAFCQRYAQDFDCVASGHYAQQRLGKDGQPELWQAPDPIKDQTYFLANLRPEQLAKAIFPIGHLSKSEVRNLAKELNLPAQDRKDSQGLCFLGKFKFSQFLEANLGCQPGDLVESETGKTIGQHKGFWFYTIGQRQGLGLSGGPWFVVSKNPVTNIVYISKNYYSVDKSRNRLLVGNFNWLSKPTEEELPNLLIKLRHGPDKYGCKSFNLLPDNQALIELDRNDQGITPGQFAVFYREGQCLGSAIILGEP